MFTFCVIIFLSNQRCKDFYYQLYQNLCREVGNSVIFVPVWPIEDFELVTSGKQYLFEESELSCNQSGGELMGINFKEVIAMTTLSILKDPFDYQF